MPIQSIEPRRLYRQIADQLRELILAGEFPVGSRLPPERDLATQLAVSRPSVREALIALEVEGLIEVRMSSGIYVLAREVPASRRVEVPYGPLEVIRARQVLEGELAAGAARSDDRRLVDDLAETLRDMEADIARQQLPIRGDRAFHLRVAQSNDNNALLAMVTQLFDERNGPLFERFGSHFERELTWRAAVDEHRRVLEAIAAHDEAAARTAMRGHLHRSHDRFAAVWNLPGESEAVVVPASTTAAPATSTAPTPRSRKTA